MKRCAHCLKGLGMTSRKRGGQWYCSERCQEDERKKRQQDAWIMQFFAFIREKPHHKAQK